MPPKPKVKELVENFDDIDQCPELNYFIFSLVLDFNHREWKDALLAKIKEQFPQGKLLSFTPDEIIEYGRQKLIIVDDGDDKLPEKWVTAFAKKLF